MTYADIRLVHDIYNILNNGYKDENPRPHYSDGMPAHTYFVNHVLRQYDLSKGDFPICTLRPIAWKSAIKEIFWIYQDQSNSLNLLQDKYGINYWNHWESKDIPETIGIRYGGTVRKHFLMDNLLLDIKKYPYGRRHILSLWKEEDFKESDGLIPCCYETIWNVCGQYIDMMLIQRSGDMLTASGAGGVNEVQYAALLLIVAKATGYKPRMFTHVIANEQIYDRHMQAAHQLLERAARQETKERDRVKMEFNPESNNFYDFRINDFELIGYAPLKPQIKLELGI